MQNKYSRSSRKTGLLGLLTALALAAFLAGCYSNMPVAENHKAYPQGKLEAADHWRDIAIDVAERVKKALGDREDLMVKPIYVRPLSDQAFVTAFGGLLKTELVSRGILVAIQPEADCTVLEYDVQTVLFDDERGNGLWANTGIAVSNVFNGNHYTSTSENEVIVNARLVYGNRFVIHSSTVAYINDNDKALYTSPVAERSRGIRIVKK